MEELFEELKHHKLKKVHFQVNRYEVVILDGVTIITASAGRMLHSLRSIRTASNPDARADDSEGGCRKEGVQECEHDWKVVQYSFGVETNKCRLCGVEKEVHYE